VKFLVTVTAGRITSSKVKLVYCLTSFSSDLVSWWLHSPHCAYQASTSYQNGLASFLAGCHRRQL